MLRILMPCESRDFLPTPEQIVVKNKMKVIYYAKLFTMASAISNLVPHIYYGKVSTVSFVLVNFVAYLLYVSCMSVMVYVTIPIYDENKVLIYPGWNLCEGSPTEIFEDTMLITAVMHILLMFDQRFFWLLLILIILRVCFSIGVSYALKQYDLLKTIDSQKCIQYMNKRGLEAYLKTLKKAKKYNDWEHKLLNVFSGANLPWETNLDEEVKKVENQLNYIAKVQEDQRVEYARSGQTEAERVVININCISDDSSPKMADNSNNTEAFPPAKPSFTQQRQPLMASLEIHNNTQQNPQPTEGRDQAIYPTLPEHTPPNSECSTSTVTWSSMHTTVDICPHVAQKFRRLPVEEGTDQQQYSDEMAGIN